MGKRFGRNQKRRMRERIQAAEADAARWKHRHDEVSALGRRNRQIVEETAQVLGRHFITLDPAHVVVRDVDALCHGWRVPAVRSEEDHMAFNQTFLETVLPVLRGTHVQDDLTGERHFRFECAGEVVGYAISERALLMMRREDRVRHIAKEMALYLDCALRKEGVQ